MGPGYLRMEFPLDVAAEFAGMIGVVARAPSRLRGNLNETAWSPAVPWAHKALPLLLRHSHNWKPVVVFPLFIKMLCIFFDVIR